LKPYQILITAEALKFAKEIRILEMDSLYLLQGAESLIVSNEDVMREFVDKYITSRSIEFDSTFLRWNRMNVVTQLPATPHSSVTLSEIERFAGIQALKCAKLSSDWWRRVGAVIFDEQEVIASAFNCHMPSERSPYIDGDPRASFNAGERIDLSTALHAEKAAIAQAVKSGRALEGASIFVTTFPCPDCAAMIVACGIKKVYYIEGYSLLNAEVTLNSNGVELILVRIDAIK
jgi:dCMP deaminase